ncbi:hypothetical protein CS542_00755 [Pedobacter sp. IW39]|nr:hypothetical protein CS542_00755 [Pedobacter sp. IW39]
MITNGYNARRSGDIYFIYSQTGLTVETGTTHGVWNPYDAHILLVLWAECQARKTNQTHHMTDIAATIAAMLIFKCQAAVGELLQSLRINK